MFNFKNHILSLGFLLIGLVSTAQSSDSFIIRKTGTNYSNEEISSALEKANLCGYYYHDIRREFIFDDGTEVELFSSAELPNLEPSCFVSYNSANESNIWRISSEGYLIRTIQTQPIK